MTHPKSKVFKSKTVKFKGYYTIIMFLVLVMLDRMTKIWAASLKVEKDFGIFAFTYVTNTGAGFSILQNMNLWLAILSIILLAAIIYYRDSVPKFSLMLIISGIVGNVIDRIFYGSVIDFINLKFWPVFNVADSMICIGVAYWIIILIKEWKEETDKTRHAKDAVHKASKKKN
jgi:signal peptidase II